MRVKAVYALLLGMLAAFGNNALGQSIRAHATDHRQQLVGNTGSTLTATEADALVAYHNRARKEVGVPYVEWSPSLANNAQEWAEEVARTGKLMHRPLEGASRRLHGENMAWGTGLAFGVLTGAESWYDEIKFYEPGTLMPDDIGSFKAAHYTQMVWKDTTEIGAGKAIIQKGEKKGWVVIVCNYSPPGNIRGQKPY
jgi:hypothetical protein